MVFGIAISAANAAIFNLTVSEDTTVHNGSDTTAWGTYSYIPTANNHWSLGQAVALVKWDLSSFAGATINSVSLKVNALEYDPSNTWEDIYAINGSWDEVSATYENTVDTAGFVGDKLAAAQVFGTGWADLTDRFTLLSSLTDIVRGWVDDSNTNNGFAFYHFSSTPISFAAKEGGSGFVLEIDYIPAPLLEGDANRDGVVSAGDYASVQSNFGNTGVAGIPGDANGDGVVSAGDYASVQANFGSTGSTDVVVPEPGSISLLCLGAIGIIRRNHKDC